MDKLYELLTLDKSAFFKLFMILPQVLDDIVEDSNENIAHNTTLQEIV